MTDFPKVGDQFGAYRVVGTIGRGGMGMVFSAIQSPMNRAVALKVLDPRLTSDLDFVARFQREADLLARMNSPHVVQVYDHGQVGECLYLAMQQVSGGDLAEYLARNGPLPPPQAADLAAQIGSALADAHALGIVHRDIKPSNILLATTGGLLFAYLCDFGIASFGQPGLTRTGMLSGTLLFTAPERHEGRGADERSDIYSLGCTLWCMLSGTNPYSGTDFQVAQQHVSGQIPQLNGDDPVRRAINDVLLHLMAKDPGDRPQSAVAASAELRQLQQFTQARASEVPTHRTRIGITTNGSPRPTQAATGGAATVAPTTLGPAALGAAGPASLDALAQPGTSHKGSHPNGRRARSTLIVTAVLLVAALISGGSLWAFSTLFSSHASVAAASSSMSPSADESSTTASISPQTTRSPVKALNDEIAVGSEPHGIAVNPGSRLGFVANYSDSSVSVVNLDTNTVVREIDVGKNPQSVAVDSASGLLLVGCDGVPAVQIYDLQGYRLVGSVSTGKGPVRLTVHSSQQVAYAVAQGSRTMEVISLSSHKLIRTVRVDPNPRVIGVDERDQIAYIGHWNSHNLTVVDLNSQSEIAQLKVGRNPNAIAIAPEARLAFVADYANGRDGGGSVAVIDLDTRSVTKMISVDDGPSRLAVDEDAGVVYLTCLWSSRVNVINLSSLSVVERIATAPRPTGAAVDTSTGRLYVSSFDRDVVQVFES